MIIKILLTTIFAVGLLAENTAANAALIITDNNSRVSISGSFRSGDDTDEYNNVERFNETSIPNSFTSDISGMVGGADSGVESKALLDVSITEGAGPLSVLLNMQASVSGFNNGDDSGVSSKALSIFDITFETNMAYEFRFDSDSISALSFGFDFTIIDILLINSNGNNVLEFRSNNDSFSPSDAVTGDAGTYHLEILLASEMFMSSIGDGGGSAVTQLAFDVVPVNAVPIPAATWLFSSGLLGLIGIARRKKA